jgi:hypothetical protein
MPAATPVRLGRVIVGVVVGLGILFLAGFGWLEYRTGQYHRHENGVVTRYRGELTACVVGGAARESCAARAAARCLADGFWTKKKPFDFGLGDDIDDAAARCRFS